MTPDAADFPDPEVAATLGLGRSRRRRWPWLFGGLGLLLALGLAGGLLRPKPGGERFLTEEITRGTLEISVTAVGTLEPLHSVSVGSDVSGVVDAVMVDTNDLVTEGQVLVRLDTTLLQAQLREAKARVGAADASLRQARVVVASAEKERQRAEQLHASGAISTSQLDQAMDAHAQAAASVGVAEAQLEQARAALQASGTSLDRATIKAPISGVILERKVEAGQAVVSSLQATTLFRVAEDLSRMSVDVDVDEADVGRVKEGQSATFTVSAWPDRVFPAVVHKVDLAPRTTVSDVVTYVACLHLDNPEGLLRPGMTASAEIVAERVEDALLVPTAALRFAPEGDQTPPPAPRDGRRVERVWVAEGETPVPVELRVGASDGRNSELLEGDLDEGDPLIVEEKAPLRRGRGTP
jgi:HlyD family secretion protein